MVASVVISSEIVVVLVVVVLLEVVGAELVVADGIGSVVTVDTTVLEIDGRELLEGNCVDVVEVVLDESPIRRTQGTTTATRITVDKPTAPAILSLQKMNKQTKNS